MLTSGMPRVYRRDNRKEILSIGRCSLQSDVRGARLRKCVHSRVVTVPSGPTAYYPASPP
jgi:hypothetical protein